MRASADAARPRQPDPLAFLQLLAFPTILTMLVSGIWHGAGYLFILWGCCTASISRSTTSGASTGRGRRPRDAAGEPGPVGQLAGFAVTFLAVVVAMVLFRAPDLAAAGNLLGGMVGLHGLGMPGTRFGAAGMHLLDGSVPVASLSPPPPPILLALLAIALLLPNSVQILAAYEPARYTPKRAAEIPGRLRPRCGRPLAWRPTAGVDGALRRPRRGVDDPAVTGMSEFLYWQF